MYYNSVYKILLKSSENLILITKIMAYQNIADNKMRFIQCAMRDTCTSCSVYQSSTSTCVFYNTFIVYKSKPSVKVAY